MTIRNSQNKNKIIMREKQTRAKKDSTTKPKKQAENPKAEPKAEPKAAKSDSLKSFFEKGLRDCLSSTQAPSETARLLAKASKLNLDSSILSICEEGIESLKNSPQGRADSVKILSTIIKKLSE